MEKSMLPTFLGIGAQRSGTTWLYENLKQHPQIWTPPIKEVHFFDNREVHYFFKKQHLLRRISNYIKTPTFRDFDWDMHYFFKRRDLNWYRAIFQPGSGQIAGEITPAYSTLEKDTVKEIYTLNPDLKIIFFMRDPIERAWSSVVKSLARDKRRAIKTIPEEKFITALNKKSRLLRGNYMRTLEIWESVFEPNQIHIDYMDEIRHSPHKVLLRLYNFLNISSDGKYLPPNLEEKVNSTDGYKTAIPKQVEYHIARQHLPQLELLSQRFGGYTTVWLKHAQNVIASSM